MKQRRNDKCSCGSGLKFKHCCRPVTMPIKSEAAFRYLAQENQVLREILAETDKRLVEAGLMSVAEWLERKKKEDSSC